MAPRPLHELIEAGWAKALEPAAERIAAMGDFLRPGSRRAGPSPAGANVLRAFQQPFDDVRVLIVGQDPYPTPGMAIGLSFAVSPEVRSLPGSLENIFRELHTDLGLPRPSNGDLTPWTEQGVLLLNRALTTAPRQPAAHRGKGWEEVTEQAIRALVALAGEAAGVDPVGAGRPQSAAAARGGLPAIESAHPSPMSADRGFFGSRPFSRANELLERQGVEPVDSRCRRAVTGSRATRHGFRGAWRGTGARRCPWLPWPGTDRSNSRRTSGGVVQPRQRRARRRARLCSATGEGRSSAPTREGPTA